jgi:crossover junction endodeoxyribonuclease RusA
MYHELYLPFPPTVNNYYKKAAHGGRYISNKGRKFRDDTIKAVLEQLPDIHLDGKLLMEVILFPPDKRQRDIDNYNKSLLDALTHSGVWEDDSQVDQLFIYRGSVRSRNGSVYIRLMDAAPVLRDANMLPE